MKEERTKISDAAAEAISRAGGDPVALLDAVVDRMTGGETADEAVGAVRRLPGYTGFFPRPTTLADLRDNAAKARFVREHGLEAFRRLLGTAR